MALPLIAAGIAAVSSGIQAGSQAGQNAADRQFTEKMYNTQRQHALEDRDWQAAYNAPSAQMQRYMDAGLNPNLIYGKVNTDAPAVRSSQVGNFSQPAPQWGNMGTASIHAFQDTQLKQAQTDNVKALTEATHAETKLKGLESVYKMLQNDMTQIDRDNYGQTKKFQLQSAQEGLRKMIMETVTGYNSDNRAWSADHRAELKHPYEIAVMRQAMAESDNRIFNSNRMTSAQIQKVGAEIRHIDSQIKNDEQLRRKMSHEINQIMANTALSEEERRKAIQYTRNLMNTGDILEYENSMKELNHGIKIGKDVLNTIIPFKGTQSDVITEFGKGWKQVHTETRPRF